MAFLITDHVQLDAKNRAQCPACMAAGKTGLNLSVSKNGAYKCFRGCTPDDIRGSLGAERPGRAAQVAPPPKPTGLTRPQVEQAHERLLNSKHALPWLLERGICREAISHYRLGAARAKVGAGHLPAVAIPIPTTDDRWGQKKRIQPWGDLGNHGWSQAGLSATVYTTNAPAKPEAVWLAEGEWDAIRLGWAVKNSELAEAIHVACFTCGAGNIPPLIEVDRLPNVPIVAFYDLDDPGRAGAKKLQDRLKNRVLIATVPAPPGAKEGWDISDSMQAGFGIEAINEAAAAAVVWVEPKRANPLRARLQTNDEMVGNARDYVDWLVTDLLTPDELFIVGMPPRGGKSLLGLTLAKSVATGTAFLDRPVTQGSVIYINLEDSPTKIKTRQQRQGWAEGLPVYWLDKFKLSELEHLRELADEIDDLRLVVIDTFSRARDDAQKESSAELGKILEPLQEWAKERGICILLTHHTGKANTDHPSADPFDSLRGSTSIRATCRGAIVIIPAEQSYRLIAENGFSDRLDIAVHINPATLEWRLNGQWLPRVDGDMKQQILDHLNLHGDATVAEIATELKFNSASVSTVMSRLHRDDMVSKQGGKGRSPARYTRSSNLLKQQTAEFEHPNPEPARDIALLKQNNLYGDSSGKVINEGKSDQCSDHFEKKAPTHPHLFEQSCEPDGASLLCSNSTTDEFEQVGSTGTETGRENNYTPPEVGSKVKYTGQNWQKQKALGRKHLTVTATTTNDEGHWVTAEHPSLAIAQTIAARDVKLIQS